MADPEQPFSFMEITREQFEQALMQVRNGATMRLADLAADSATSGEPPDDEIEDVRAVWHAAEVALGLLLFPRYVPKREAMDDLRALLTMYENPTKRQPTPPTGEDE